MSSVPYQNEHFGMFFLNHSLVPSNCWRILLAYSRSPVVTPNGLIGLIGAVPQVKDSSFSVVILFLEMQSTN